MRVLITAGATWVKIDDVRILTNRFTGRTGLYLAKGLKKKGHSVTLLANPHCLGKIKGLKTHYYHYFDDFKKQVVKLLKSNRYDAIIHTAAVSDYKLKKTYKGKIASAKKTLNLQLIPTEKVIKTIRRLAKKSLLIQFKLEAERKALLAKAYQSLKKNRSDFVVANAFVDLHGGYKGFLMDRGGEITYINSKDSLLNALHKNISK
jgi:phosphopantothenoylcysteine synthetase/decarboxylase